MRQQVACTMFICYLSKAFGAPCWKKIISGCFWLELFIQNGKMLGKPIRDNPKIFTKSEKMFLKAEKIFQIIMFFGNHRWRVYEIRKIITNLKKILNPQKIFCKSQTNLQIQELSLNPEKYSDNPKKYFVTCYLHQQSASVRVYFRHFAQSKMAEEQVWVYIL